MKTKVIGKHSEDCYAIRNFKNGTWSTPWAFITDEVTSGRKNAPVAKNGHDRWVYAICNCTTCSAKIAIRERDILDLISKPVRERKRK